jgi:hypothetical protein
VENAGPDFWVILNFHTFGWRFKFLTYLTLCTLVGYFIIAFLTDAIPILRLSHCQYFVDWLFTTIVLPFSLIVGFFFWAVYAIDREYVFPSSIDNYLPFHLNHLIHTVLLFVVPCEVLLVKHKYPSASVAIVTMLTLSAIYTTWICIVRYKTGLWVYPFMEHFTALTFCLFIGVSTTICIAFYYIGWALSLIAH